MLRKKKLNLFPDTYMREKDLSAHLDDHRTRVQKPEATLAFVRTEQSDDEKEAQRVSSVSFRASKPIWRVKYYWLLPARTEMHY